MQCEYISTSLAKERLARLLKTAYVRLGGPCSGRPGHFSTACQQTSLDHAHLPATISPKGEVMPILRMSKEEARDIVHGRNPNFERVETNSKYMGKGLHKHTKIVHQLDENRYWRTEYTEGTKFSGGMALVWEPFDIEEPHFEEVVPEEIVTIRWHVVGQAGGDAS